MDNNSLYEALEPVLMPVISELLKKSMETILSSNDGRRESLPEWVDVKKASEITTYSVTSLYQMKHQGKIPGTKKVGGKLLFNSKALLEWIDQGGTKKSVS